MLNKVTVPIVLDKGIDTKTSKKSLQGKLLVLENGIFQTGMEIRKRNGYIALPSLGAGVMLSPYNNELVTLDGTSLYSYNANGATQVSKGALPTTTLSVSTVVRNTTQQTLQDSAINGTLSCFTWIDSVGGIQYSVFDTVTNQSIVNAGVVSATGSTAKVLALGSYFIILYTDTGTTLKYKSINTSTPTTISSSTTISSNVNASKNFDACVLSPKLFVAFDNDSTGITMFSLTSSLVLSSATTIGGSNASEAIAVIGDNVANEVWVVFSTSAHAVKYLIRNKASLGSVLATTAIETASTVVKNITGTAVNGAGTAFYEINASLSYNHFVRSVTLTRTGTVGTPATLLRSVGLASKSFVYSSTNYFWVSFSSPLQPTYFLVNGSGLIVAKLAPGVGGGLTTAPLLSEVVATTSNTFLFSYLIKDLLTAIDGSVYTQTGVGAAILTFSSSAPAKFILGKNLMIPGGIINMYDGGSVVEHGFNVFPEGLASTLSLAGDGYASAPDINATGGAQYQYSAVYEWTDNQGQLHRSAPSVPTTMAMGGVVPRSFDGHRSAYGSGTSNQITGIADTSTIAVGQYVNLLGGGFVENLTVVSVDSSTQITVSGLNGSFLVPGSAGDMTFIVSNQPMGYTASITIAGGSPVVTIPMGGNQAANLAVGQRLFWPKPYGGNTADSPFPTNLTIVAYTPMVPGVSNGSVTLSAPATFAFDLSTYNNASFFTFDTIKVTTTVPTLRLTSKLKVSLALYRTALNGTIFYRATSPISLTYNDKTADTVSIADTTSDGTLIGNEQLYTTGGEVENIEAPAIGAAATFKSRAIVVPSEDQLSWWPSKQVIPGSPVEFSDSFVQNIDSKIGAIKSVGVLDDKIIFGGPTSLFYVVGNGPALNGLSNDYTDAQLISSDVGCQNQASMILMPFGLMFQSQKGIYLLDRSLAVQYIGADVEAYNSYTVTSAQLMNDVNQVRFTLSNGTELVYDYYYKQWDVFAGLLVNDSGIFQNQHTILKSSGVIWQESPGVYSDNAVVIPLKIQSNWMSFANIQGFQRVYSFLLLGEYKSPHTLTVNIYTDFNDTTPSQVVTIPVLTNPGDYQYRVFLSKQKTESVKIEIIESQDSPGEGFSITSMAFIVGVKQGAFKVSAAKSFG